MCNDAGFVRLERAVGQPEFGQIVPCECARQRSRSDQADRLQRYSNLGDHRETFEKLMGGISGEFLEACETARSFARREPASGQDEVSDWIVVWSSALQVKTAIGAAMAMERIGLGVPALYFVTPDLLDLLRAAYSKDSDMPFPRLFEKVRSAPFLVLDDLDASNPTAWAQEKLFQILNHRAAEALPTAVLLGSDPASLPDPMGSLVRRFAQAHVVGVGGSAQSNNPGRADRYQQIGGMTLDGLERYDFEGFRVEGYGLTDEEAENLAIVRNVTRAWAQQPQGWLTLVGLTGTGKTHLAAAIARARVAQGDRVHFAVVPDLLDHLRRAYGPTEPASYDEVLDSLREADLLVLDDLGAHSTTAWAQEKLYQLFSYRYLQRKPTVITTNANPEELDPRLSSRLLDHEVGQVYRLLSRDHRTGTRDRPSGPPKPRRGGKWDTPRW